MRGWTNRRIFYWALLVFVALAFSLVLLNISLTWQDGDEGRYYVLAKAMAAGQGQMMIQFPVPQPDWLTPPAYLWTLAMLMRYVSESVVFLKIVSALTYVVFAVVLLLFVRRTGLSPVMTWAVAVIGYFNVWMLSYVWLIFTEPMFMLFSYLLLLLVLQADDRDSDGWIPWLGLLAGYCILIRQVGLALLPAGFLHFAVRKQWKRALIFIVFALAINVPTAVRNWHLTGTPFALISYQAQTASGSGFSQWTATGGILAQAVPFYFFHSLPRWMFFSLFDYHCFLGILRLSWLVLPGALLICGLILLGFISRLRRPGVLEFYWLLFWPMISAHPIWPQERYILPIIPLASFYLVSGLKIFFNLFPFLRPSIRHGMSAACAGLCALYILAVALGAGVVRTKHEWSYRELHPWDPVRYEATDLPWARYVEAGFWIRDHLPSNTVVACRKSDHMFLFSGRRAFRYDGVEIPGANTWDLLNLEAAYGPVVIVQDAFPTNSGYGFTRAARLDPVIEQHRGELKLLYESRPPVTRLWALQGEGKQP